MGLWRRGWWRVCGNMATGAGRLLPPLELNFVLKSAIWKEQVWHHAAFAMRLCGSRGLVGARLSPPLQLKVVLECVTQEHHVCGAGAIELAHPAHQEHTRLVEERCACMHRAPHMETAADARPPGACASCQKHSACMWTHRHRRRVIQLMPTHQEHAPLSMRVMFACIRTPHVTNAAD